MYVKSDMKRPEVVKDLKARCPEFVAVDKNLAELKDRLFEELDGAKHRPALCFGTGEQPSVLRSLTAVPDSLHSAKGDIAVMFLAVRPLMSQAACDHFDSRKEALGMGSKMLRGCDYRLLLANEKSLFEMAPVPVQEYFRLLAEMTHYLYQPTHIQRTVDAIVRYIFTALRAERLKCDLLLRGQTKLKISRKRAFGLYHESMFHLFVLFARLVSPASCSTESKEALFNLAKTISKNTTNYWEEHMILNLWRRMMMIPLRRHLVNGDQRLNRTANDISTHHKANRPVIADLILTLDDVASTAYLTHIVFLADIHQNGSYLENRGEWEDVGGCQIARVHVKAGQDGIKFSLAYLSVEEYKAVQQKQFFVELMLDDEKEIAGYRNKIDVLKRILQNRHLRESVTEEIKKKFGLEAQEELQPRDDDDAPDETPLDDDDCENALSPTVQHELANLHDMSREADDSGSDEEEGETKSKAGSDGDTVVVEDAGNAHDQCRGTMTVSHLAVRSTALSTQTARTARLLLSPEDPPIISEFDAARARAKQSGVSAEDRQEYHRCRAVLLPLIVHRVNAISKRLEFLERQCQRSNDDKDPTTEFHQLQQLDNFGAALITELSSTEPCSQRVSRLQPTRERPGRLTRGQTQSAMAQRVTTRESTRVGVQPSARTLAVVGKRRAHKLGQSQCLKKRRRELDMMKAQLEKDEAAHSFRSR